MRFVRVGLLAILGLFQFAVAQADPYTFWVAQNHLNQPLTWAAYESPQEACEASEGLLYNGAPLDWVSNSEFVHTLGQCGYRLESNTIQFGPVVSAVGSCPGSQVFHFGLSQCGSFSSDEDHLAVALATYLWLCLIGGVLVGFRASQ